MNTWLMAAAATAALTTAVHFFLGGAAVARPLLQAEFDGVAKYTNYFCWHIVTIVLAAMAGGYAYAALVPAGLDVAILVTALAASYVVWNLVMIAQHRLAARKHPQFVFFVPMTAIALPGILGT